MRIVGLDLSLTATGVADGGGTRTLSTKLRGVERLSWFYSQIQDVVEKHATDTIVILEGYSFGSKFSHAHSLGELGGIARVALFRIGVPFAEVPPKVLKKYATGNGNSGKDEVIAAAIRKFDFAGHSNNEADACILRHIGLAQYSGDTVTKEHQLLLTKVAWP